MKYYVNNNNEIKDFVYNEMGFDPNFIRIAKCRYNIKECYDSKFLYVLRYYIEDGEVKKRTDAEMLAHPEYIKRSIQKKIEQRVTKEQRKLGLKEVKKDPSLKQEEIDYIDNVLAEL